MLLSGGHNEPMFIKTLNKALSVFQSNRTSTTVLTGRRHQGLCGLLQRAKTSTSRHVRRPLHWSLSEDRRDVIGIWPVWKSQPKSLDEALEGATTEQRRKWVVQLLDACSTLNGQCETLLFDAVVIIDENDDLILDISGCQTPTEFHSKDVKNTNRKVFWLAIVPLLPRWWRTNFCLQQWMGEHCYKILTGDWYPYQGNILSWFYSSQAGNTNGVPEYNEPKGLSRELADALRTSLTLNGNRFGSFEAAIGALKNALNDSAKVA